MVIYSSIAYFAGYNESNGLDGRAIHFVSACNFTVRNVESASRKEAHPALRFRGLVLGKSKQGV